MKKTRSMLLAILSFSVVLVLATGCFRPAAPDVTPTSAGGAEAATPGEPDLEATAIANSTQAAQTLEAQTAEAEPGDEEPTVGEEEDEATSTPPPATATPEPDATETPAPATPCPPTPAPTEAPTDTPAPTGETTYVVQRGDNLFRIAQRYGTTWEAIAQANGITDVTQVAVGQELVIPTDGQPAPPAPSEGTTYVVRPGDNLFRIALRFNMDYRRLAAYNGIANPSNIYVGQVLKIPPR